MTWFIYYGDGSVISSVFADPYSLSVRSDVQVIIQPDDKHVWYSQSGDDYYIWRDNRWWGVDQFGLYDYLLQPGEKCVLFGRTITNERFREIWDEAQEHMKEITGYEKGAFRKGERKP